LISRKPPVCMYTVSLRCFHRMRRRRSTTRCDSWSARSTTSAASRPTPTPRPRAPPPKHCAPQHKKTKRASTGEIWGMENPVIPHAWRTMHAHSHSLTDSEHNTPSISRCVLARKLGQKTKSASCCELQLLYCRSSAFQRVGLIGAAARGLALSILLVYQSTSLPVKHTLTCVHFVLILD